MTTATTHPHIDIDAVRAELASCEQVQSWAPGSTRSSWINELRAVIEAHDEWQKAHEAAEAAYAAYEAETDDDERDRLWEAAQNSAGPAEDDAELRLSEAVSQAKTRAFELAEEVARGLATDVDGLRDALSEGDDSLVEAFEDAGTIAELVEVARTHGVTVDDAALGERDGYEVNGSTAIAYATVRTWDGTLPWVQVDLLTGEARREA